MHDGVSGVGWIVRDSPGLSWDVAVDVGQQSVAAKEEGSLHDADVGQRCSHKGAASKARGGETLATAPNTY